MTPQEISSGTMTSELAGWIRGCDSLTNPWLLGSDQYRWGVNIINRGGIPQTRPGRELRLILPPGNFQGGIIFHATKEVELDDDKVPLDDYYLVLVASGIVYAVPFDLAGVLFQPLDWRDFQLSGVSLNSSVPEVFLATPERAARRVSGSLEAVRPHKIVMIQDGINGAVYWDGEVLGQERVPSSAEELTFSGVPIGTWMAESGDRLWVVTPRGVVGADLKDPLSFTERLDGDTRGDFTFGDPVTGIVDYHNSDEQAILVVFTATTRSILLSGVRDRASWPTVAGGFQRLLDPSVGCTSGRSIVFQGGLMYWWSPGGLVACDPATQRYHTDDVPYRDMEMARVKAGLSDNVSHVCGAAFERFLLMSVPNEEYLNSQTMVYDLGTRSDQSSGCWVGVWTGTRPIQWVVGEVRGVNRIFQLSIDYQSLNNGSHLHVWEEFRSEQNDVYFRLNPDNTLSQFRRRIYCNVETALVGQGMDFKELKYAEFDLTKVGGDVDLRVSYRSQRGEAGIMLNAKLRALYFNYQLEGQKSAQEAVAKIGRLLPQSRRLRTQEIERDDSEVGGNTAPRNVDRAFSIVFEWCGQAGLDALSVVMMPYPEGVVGELDVVEVEASALGEAGTLSMVLPKIGVEDKAVNPLQNSWVSTQSASFSEPCPGESITESVVVTAEVTYRSFISSEDASMNALSLAQSRATQEANRIRSQSPCTWQSFRYADRTCRPELNGEVLGVATNFDSQAYALVGAFTQDRATSQNRLTARLPSGTRLLSLVNGTGFNNVARFIARANTGAPSSQKYLVVGNFTAYDGSSTANRWAILSSTGALESAATTALGTAANPLTVYETIGINTGLFYAVGIFTSFNGVSRNGGVAINSVTGVLESFNPTYTAETVDSCRAIYRFASFGARIFVVMALASDAGDLRLVEVNAAGLRLGSFAGYTFAAHLIARPIITAALEESPYLYLSTGSIVVQIPLGTPGITTLFTASAGTYISGLAVRRVSGGDDAAVCVATTLDDGSASTVTGIDLVTLATVWAVVVNGKISGVRLSVDGNKLAVWGDFTDVDGKTLTNFALLSPFSGAVDSIYEYEVRSASAQSLVDQADADSIALNLATQAVQLALPCV